MRELGRAAIVASQRSSTWPSVKHRPARAVPLKYAPRHRQDPYPAVKARSGEIVLTTPTRRAIFFAGLVGAVMLALLVTLFALVG